MKINLNKLKINFRSLFSASIVGMALGTAINAYSLPADFYATSSVMAEGNWAKVEVKETGMQFLSNSTLRNLGFSDPSKVNVYGYGGRMLSERLDNRMPDDLPLVKSVKTSTGILFFGFGTIGWDEGKTGYSVYSHTINPYSDNSYYFISDREVGPTEEIQSSVSPQSDVTLTSFTERLAHEQDLLAPSNTGRLMLGEDFRVQSTRSFPFDLPGNIGDAVVTVRFGAKVSSGSAALMFTANGKELPSEKADQIAASSSSVFITTTNTVKTVEDPGEKLNLSIQFSNSGAISTAALDYIEVEYPRQLKLTNNELYFYLSPEVNTEVKIEGGNESTIIWDVTDPRNMKVVSPNVQGTTLSFVMPAGYHEYVAFNPSGISRSASPAGRIQNQNLHSLPAPGMLIISPDIYRNAAERIAELHAKTDGLDVLVVSPEQIYNEFSSGVPEVTAYRKLLKMWYDRAGGREGEYTGYCLIMSRPTYDNKMVTAAVRNAGYPRLPIWQSPTGDTESSSYSTDDYIGMLDDNISDLNIGTAKIHVAVGRMPVKNAGEASIAVEKLENYILNPKLGSWRNNVMVIADDQDNGVHLNQAESCIEELRSSGNGSSFLYEKLYLDSYPMVYTGTGPAYPEAKQRMFEKLSEGVLYIDYIGHANPSAWGHENLLTWTDITSMTNTNLPFLYAATCEFLRWDDDAVSGAEIMWLNPTAGVIGMICPSRSVLISANGVLNKATSGFVFRRDSEGKGMRVGDIMIEGKNSGQADSNKLRYGLLGDPSMRLPVPTYNVAVESIGNVDLKNGVMPQIMAREKVDIEGCIEDINGNLLSDFNGTVEIQLYDAEKVITTLGNGSDGVNSVYNDRKTRLYSGRVKVVNGKWSTTVSMPSEIENNYSPALLSLYAYDNSGREANGACEQFYVYGFDESAPEDTDGPVISEIYLDSPNFNNGDLVSPTPVFTAKFHDESGINVSDAGIGHSMVIGIDGKTFFNDVALYYMADESNPLAGTVTYPIGEVEPGEHTLSFTVWDNANNSTTETLTFNVAASWTPQIATLTTDVNPASSSVNFIVATGGLTEGMECMLDVFDLSGRKVWTSGSSALDSYSNNLRMGWNLCDFNGARVPRGIYLYRATLTSPDGSIVTKTKKLAVTAQ